MKRLAIILAMVILLAACTNPQSVEVPESTQEFYTFIQTLAEIKTSEPAEFLLDIPPHHYGNFDEVVYVAASTLFDIAEFEVFAAGTPNIVRGRMGDDARNLMGNHRLIGTIVSFEVLEVIQGDIQVGQTIRIKEPYFVVDGTLRTRGDYLPSIPNQEYIFFLQSASTVSQGAVGEAIGAFWTFHSERSRYPVPINAPDIHTFSAATQDFGTGVFGLGSGADVEVYMQLWEDVMNEWVAAELTGIFLSHSEATVPVASTLTLAAAVLPSDYNPVITWTSSNPNVATVDASGVVTGVTAGTVTITAATDSGMEATCEVLVVASTIRGDVNGDGVVDFLDLLALIYYLDNNGNIPEGMSFVRENADLNGDGVINRADLMILMHMLGNL